MRIALLVFIVIPCFAVTREVGSGQTHATIAACIVAASAADVCNIHAGTYSEDVTISKAITIRANTGDSPIISGTVTFTSGGATLSGLTVTTTSCSYLISASGLDQVTIQNNTAHGCANGYGIYTRNSTRVLITGNTVYGNETGIGFISCHSTDGTYANGCTISNNTVHDNPEDGTEGNGEYVTLSGNNVYNNIDTNWAANHPDGIQFLGACADGYCAGNHWMIYSNTFRNQTQNIFIEGTAGDASSDALDVWIFNNIAYNDGSTVNGVNLSTLSTVSLMLKNARNAYVFGNYFGSSGASGTSAHIQGCYDGSIHFQNNIVVNMVSYGLYAEDPADFASGELDYNLYYTGGAEPIIWGSSFYSTVAAFHAAVSTMEAHGVGANPALNALPAPTPQAGSPVISAGVDLSSLGVTALNSDKAGVARGANWDIGAYQYASASSSALSGKVSISGKVTLK